MEAIIYRLIFLAVIIYWDIRNQIGEEWHVRRGQMEIDTKFQLQNLDEIT
jgi:hypothetical protein